jgi:predicted tellurium resistance membrane protein TerC
MGITTIKRKEKRRKALTLFTFILNILSLLLAALDTISNARPLIGIVYLLFAVFLITSLRYYFRIKQYTAPFLTLTGAFVLYFIAFDMFLQGKKYLPYAYLFTGSVTIAAFLIQLFFSRKRKQSTRSVSGDIL